MNAKEFTKQRINNDWDGKIYLGFYEDEEIDIFKMMEMYAQFKAENLPISDVVGQSEQLVCDVCGSDDVMEAPHLGRNCNRCHPL